jgi:hypothetical protein
MNPAESLTGMMYKGFRLPRVKFNGEKNLRQGWEVATHPYNNRPSRRDMRTLAHLNSYNRAAAAGITYLDVFPEIFNPFDGDETFDAYPNHFGPPQTSPYKRRIVYSTKVQGSIHATAGMRNYGLCKSTLPASISN